MIRRNLTEAIASHINMKNPMTNFAKLVPIPDLDTVNIGLSPCHQATMLKIFGRPGALSKDCSDYYKFEAGCTHRNS